MGGRNDDTPVSGSALGRVVVAHGDGRRGQRGEIKAQGQGSGGGAWRDQAGSASGMEREGGGLAIWVTIVPPASSGIEKRLYVFAE